MLREPVKKTSVENSTLGSDPPETYITHHSITSGCKCQNYVYTFIEHITLHILYIKYIKSVSTNKIHFHCNNWSSVNIHTPLNYRPHPYAGDAKTNTCLWVKRSGNLIWFWSGIWADKEMDGVGSQFWKLLNWHLEFHIQVGISWDGNNLGKFARESETFWDY